ncbi:exosortase [Congregibacter sp.]|jgi:exosortase|uniref:exosortase n=1 Tax=Congregibacter sp. TaxID=2744308 RepID=UPI0039E28D31
MIEDSSSSSSSTKLRPLVFIGAVFAAFFLTNPAIIADWRSFSFDDGSYSHAYLILPLCAYLFWDANRHNELVVHAKAWCIPLLCLALYILIVARLSQFAFLERVITPIPIILALVSLFRVRLSLIIPAVLLWFITPIWGVLNGPLQEGSARAVEAAMRLTGIPTFVEGNLVHIPAGVFEIAEGCSGLRYVVAALAIALVYCHMHFRKWPSIVLFATLAIVGAIVTNWIRILVLVLLGHSSDMQSEIIRDHNMLGWYLFIPLMLLLMFVGGKLERSPETTQEHLLPSAGADSESSSTMRVFALVLLCMVVISGLGVDKLVNGKWKVFEPALAIDDLVPSRQSDFVFAPTLYGAFARDDVSVSAGMPAVSVYRFSGEGVLSKPDFYLNILPPDGWQECGDPYSVGIVHRTLLCRAGETAVLDVLYAADDKLTGDVDRLRVLRLIQAARLASGSAMYWWFARCSEIDCAALGPISPVEVVARRKTVG